MTTIERSCNGRPLQLPMALPDVNYSSADVGSVGPLAFVVPVHDTGPIDRRRLRASLTLEYPFARRCRSYVRLRFHKARSLRNTLGKPRLPAGGTVGLCGSGTMEFSTTETTQLASLQNMTSVVEMTRLSSLKCRFKLLM